MNKIILFYALRLVSTLTAGNMLEIISPSNLICYVFGVLSNPSYSFENPFMIRIGGVNILEYDLNLVYALITSLLLEKFKILNVNVGPLGF